MYEEYRFLNRIIRFIIKTPDTVQELRIQIEIDRIRIQPSRKPRYGSDAKENPDPA